jgi:hypothetical protein
LKIVVAGPKDTKIYVTILVHVTFAKIGAAGPKVPIFATIVVHDQHIIIHVISAKIGAAGSKTPIFAT